MAFFFTDPDVEQLAPADTHLLDLRAEPYPNGKCLRITMELTPFRQKPYLELTLTDSIGEVVATTTVLKPVASSLDFTLHIRKLVAHTNAVYKLAIILSYPDLGEIDHRDLTVEIPSPMV